MEDYYLRPFCVGFCKACRKKCKVCQNGYFGGKSDILNNIIKLEYQIAVRHEWRL